MLHMNKISGSSISITKALNAVLRFDDNKKIQCHYHSDIAILSVKKSNKCQLKFAFFAVKSRSNEKVRYILFGWCNMFKYELRPNQIWQAEDGMHSLIVLVRSKVLPYFIWLNVVTKFYIIK